MSRRPRVPRDAALLGLFVLLLLVISWRRWGNPVSDPGLDLTVSANWLHGIEPYRDTRYWYGPLGISGLAATFAVLGTSFTAAYAYGLVQTALIAELWRRLAVRWLPRPVALAGVGAVLAIGFSGSLFNFQLPHTEAATAGLACLLGLLLALAAGRRWMPGVLLGALALTRPEFLAFGVAAMGGAALGAVRADGWRAALALLLRAAPGALVVAVPVLGWFAHRAGASSLFTENLFPVEFVKVVGTRAEAGWHPYDLPSLGGLVLRGTLVVAAAAVLEALVRRDGLVAALVRAAALAAGGAVAATLLGAIGGEPVAPVKAVAQDAGRLLLPMTVLPVIALTTLLAAARAWWRRARTSPLGGGWVADGALIATAAACTLRAYDAFTTDVYATYFAPPAVLVAAILLLRFLHAAAGEGVAPGAGRAQLATALVLAAGALALTAHAWLGRYRDFTVPVHSARGTFVATTAAGPNVQRVVDLLAPRVRPREPMLVLPQEAGFHFLLGTRPALYAATFLPGTLAPASEDAQAARDLARGRAGAPPPRFVVVAARRFTALGFGQSGEDFNVALHRVLRRDYRVLARFGDTARPVTGDEPPTAYTVYERAR